jgi:hypothetical protein
MSAKQRLRRAAVLQQCAAAVLHATLENANQDWQHSMY